MSNISFPTEVIAVITSVTGLVVLGLFYIIFKSFKSDKTIVDNVPEAVQPIARRAIGNRNRIRNATGVRRDDGNNGQDPSERSSTSATDVSDFKMGTKKRAKMEAKADKKAQREVELKIREERKLQREKEEVDRKLRDEKEKLDEERQEEERRRQLEEKIRNEEEQYQKMKVAFSVEEEGFDDDAEDGQSNLLQEFIAYIQKQKVVMLEDLAAKFRLKIQTVISRIEELLSTGAITGVIDDRGKFIYITMDELQAVANFVKKRGRVSIQELAENSNNLISLT